MLRRPLFLLALGLGVITVSAVAAGDLSVTEVFSAFVALDGEAPRIEYLKKNAGHLRLAGAGKIEAVVLRSFFDTSVPDSNPKVALIHVAAGKKVVCGLAESLHEGGWKAYTEGSPVSLQGNLVDIQDWGDWVTLYLADCSLELR